MKLSFGEIKGLCPPGRPRSSTFNDVVVRVVETVKVVGQCLLTRMHKTSCSGETRLVLHVPSMIPSII